MSGADARSAGRLFVLPGEEELARAAAGRFCGIVCDRAEALFRAGKAGRPIVVAVSGGQTPRRTLQVLSSEPYRSRFPWELVSFFQADERWVPPEDRRSNRRMLEEALFSSAPEGAKRFHPVDTTHDRPEEAARIYSETLRSIFPEPSAGFPRLDAILLGIGADGHTASLFPGAPLDEGGSWFMATAAAGDPPARRITMTLPSINAAANVIFIVSGEEKGRALREVLDGNTLLPASRISPARGKVTFLADADAAALSIAKHGR